MGGHAVTDDVEILAEELGGEIARAGWILLNGGRDEGVMRGSAKGAHDAGGFVVGLHPGMRDDGDVAPGLDLCIFTGIGFARNMSNVLSSDVVVALPGSYGTLNEVAYAKTFGKPVVLFGFLDEDLFGEGVTRVNTIAECMQAIRRLLA